VSENNKHVTLADYFLPVQTVPYVTDWC